MSTLETIDIILAQLVKHQIAHQFSRAASTYDEAAQLQIKMADLLIEWIPEQTKGKLADLGCGTGKALEKIARQKRFDLFAIDIASGMIQVAQSRVPNATFHCCDLEETPIPSDAMDVVFSNAAIQWCNTLDAIQEMARICKPGGNIVFSTFGPKTLCEIRSAWESVEPNGERVHRFDPSSKIAELLTASNLRQLEFETRVWNLEYDSATEMLRSLKQLGATNASSTRQTGLLGSTTFRKLHAALDSGKSEAGKLVSTFECFFVSATKPS